MIAPNLIQIAVIGAGLIGPRHASHVVNNAHAELFAIVDPSPTAKEIAASMETRYFTSIQNMIAYCDQNGMSYPDGAIICTPNHTHIRVSAELANYGINLLVEKPLSSIPEEAKALKNFAKEKNVKVLVGHHRRFNPFIVEAKRNLHKVGDVIAISGTWALRKPESYFKMSPWRTDNKTGGGVLLINLVHDIDLLQYMFGPIERIYAELLKKQRSHYPDADEGAALTIKFKNGITGTFICSDNVTSPFNFESGTGENPTVPFQNELEGFYRVFGSKGTLSVPDLHLFHQPEAVDDNTNSWLHPIEKEQLVENKLETLHSQMPFDLQLDHFVDVIRGRAEPLCSADDGMSALMCIDAVMKSVETGIPQYVEDIKNIIPDYEALGLDSDLRAK
ncbi:hypothetical protein G9P44_002423 [Scheffersomyces stipitis]|nr:hypothetical protein G9P44_002423 [Scheffersomyces stipitis]